MTNFPASHVCSLQLQVHRPQEQGNSCNRAGPSKNTSSCREDLTGKVDKSETCGTQSFGNDGEMKVTFRSVNCLHEIASYAEDWVKHDVHRGHVS